MNGNKEGIWHQSMIGGKFQDEVSQLRDHGAIGKEARARPIICNQLFLTDTNTDYQNIKLIAIIWSTIPIPIVLKVPINQ